MPRAGQSIFSEDQRGALTRLRASSVGACAHPVATLRRVITVDISAVYPLATASPLQEVFATLPLTEPVERLHVNAIKKPKKRSPIGLEHSVDLFPVALASLALEECLSTLYTAFPSDAFRDDVANSPVWT
jgi:hypothetical protein